MRYSRSAPAYLLAKTSHRRLALSSRALEDREFEDGEYKIRPLENVRGRDCYVVFTLNGDDVASSADKLCKLLFFVGALKDAGAQRVTAVTPYLCFARKDRRTKPRDPVTTRYVAQLFEALGTDRVVCVDVHDHRRLSERLSLRDGSP